MKCQHIDKALDKINNLIRRMNNDDFSLCETKGPFIKEEDIRTHLDNMGSYYKARTTWDYTYSFKLIRRSALYDSLSDIFDELNSCNCRSEMNSKLNELEDRLNDLRDDFKEKEAELEEERRQRRKDKEEQHSERLRWTKTEGEIKTAKARIEERLEGSSSQVIELRKRLTDSENQVARIENRLDERNRTIQSLTNQLADLRVEGSEKDSKLREKEGELERKNEEIKNSQNQAGLSKEELLKEKLRSEKVNLELFVSQLEVSLEQINSLSKYHEKLFKARKERNQVNSEVHEENIERVKQELLEKKVNIINIQEICRKCERIAELRSELGFEPIQSQTQPQKQANYSSGRERNWKNINPNFTPELVQEWKNYGFTYEECADWVNINSPEKQNQAIKEPPYYAWLRDIKQVDSYWVLNEGDSQQLSQEFFQWWQQQNQYQVQQEQPTK